MFKQVSKTVLGSAIALGMLGAAHAAVDTYVIDPSHTFPSFEADHMGGLSLWRGQFEKTKGMVTLDRANKTGTVDIEIDAASLDFGHGKMNEHAKDIDMFDVEAHPTITYTASKMRFEGDKPVEVLGNLTLKGITKPVPLKINTFKCIMHPMKKAEVCGADAVAEFKRTDFDLGYGVDRGFFPEVKVLITIEAVKQPK
ncbi:YceI family protein [Limnobacter sp. 130]|jgi:polyisoprenoid-binding protein YceI|uniref:YceI family protein n=1 Tax=unclassified Limnobacter TaxID=2630203 RepID=UPI0012EFC380|nr:YceI family protein [Limnobacter sp. 130]VWX34995.1 Polyisoprenoid-binding protein [Limnobacter sp. 130]